MANILAILEDDVNRVAMMRKCTAEQLSSIKLVVFDRASEMISWLREHLDDVALISLDHDLPIRDSAGIPMDFGTGRQVAEFLASCPPTCPVIVHSSNDSGASGMFFVLKEKNWPCSRIYPCDDLAWIESSWVAQVRRYIEVG